MNTLHTEHEHPNDRELARKGYPPLLALTLMRPWSAVIRQGIKRLENRKWEPGARLRPGEWFAVHAGLKYDQAARDFIEKIVPGITFDEGDLSVGAIVAVARFDGTITDEDPRSKDPWFFGPFAWALGDVVAIDPVPCRGAQGLWEVPALEASRVREAFLRARPPAAARREGRA